MSTTTLDMNAEPLELEVLGRRFPADWGVRRSQTKVQPKQLKPTTEQRQLKDLVDESIRGTLAWFATRTTEEPCETLVASYIQSLNQLDRYRRDVDGMIRAAWMPVRNVVDARLVSRPALEIRTKLESALKQAVTDFCQQFFDLLAKMVDRELFGLVEWLPNNCCAYHFFRRVIIGTFVLTGWGPREVQAEIQRREAVARDEAAKQAFNSATTRWPCLVAASILLAVASVWLTLVSNRGSLSELLTLICIGGTFLSIRHAACDRAW